MADVVAASRAWGASFAAGRGREHLDRVECQQLRASRRYAQRCGLTPCEARREAECCPF